MIKRLWPLFFSLQLIAYINIFSFDTPAFTLIVLGELKSLVKFESLNPEGIVRVWNPDFVLLSWLIAKKKVLVTHKNQMQSMLGDMEVYILIGFFALLLVSMLFLLMLIPCCRNKVKELLLSIRKKTFWNGIIQYFNVAYIEITISCLTQLVMLVNGSEYQAEADKYACLAMTAVVILIPVTFA